MEKNKLVSYLSWGCWCNVLIWLTDSVLTISTKYQLSHYHSSLCFSHLHPDFPLPIKINNKAPFLASFCLSNLVKSQPRIISLFVKWTQLDEQMKGKCSHGYEYSSIKWTSQPVSQPCLFVTVGVASPQRDSPPGAMLAGIQEPQLNHCVTAINDANLFIYLEIFRPCLIEVWTLLGSG